MAPRPRTALRLDALAWAYEPIAMRLCRARVWRPAVVAAVAPRPHARILDLGCGPGTLCRLLAQTCPAAEIVGIDPDPVMLARARRAAAGPIRFVAASATALPATPPSDRPFDVCVSTLMFHHLAPDDKRAALGEAQRGAPPRPRTTPSQARAVSGMPCSRQKTATTAPPRDGAPRGRAQSSARIGLRISPSLAMPVTMVCPARRNAGGVIAAPTPGGVPVATTSPGSSANMFDR